MSSLLSARIHGSGTKIQIEKLPFVRCSDLPSDQPMLSISNDLGRGLPRALYVTQEALERVGIPKIILSPGRLTDWHKAIRQTSVMGIGLLESGRVVLPHIKAENYKIFRRHILSKIQLMICGAFAAICCGRTYVSKIAQIPEMFLFSDSKKMMFAHVIIDLANLLGSIQKTQISKIKKCLLITGKSGPQIIVQKILIKKDLVSVAYFDQTVRALETFRGQRGIVSLIAGGRFNETEAIFLPLYDSNLEDFFEKGLFGLTFQEKLEIINDWFFGLVTVSRKGVHNHISCKNLLLSKGARPKGAIGGFGSYQPHGVKNVAPVSYRIAAPERFRKQKATAKSDVWSLGICLHRFMSPNLLPVWDIKNKEQAGKWVAQLFPGWSRAYSLFDEAPDWMIDLIDDMLQPDPSVRLSPESAQDRFLSGYQKMLQTFPLKSRYQMQEIRRIELKVPSGRFVQISEFGNRSGIPVVVLCGASKEENYRVFDPNVYWILAVRQKGARHRYPSVSDLNRKIKISESIQDLESIRTYLKIDQWVMFGSGWRALVSIRYAQLQGGHCLGLVLHNIYLPLVEHGSQLRKITLLDENLMVHLQEVPIVVVQSEKAEVAQSLVDLLSTPQNRVTYRSVGQAESSTADPVVIDALVGETCALADRLKEI